MKEAAFKVGLAIVWVVLQALATGGPAAGGSPITQACAPIHEPDLPTGSRCIETVELSGDDLSAILDSLDLDRQSATRLTARVERVNYSKCTPREVDSIDNVPDGSILSRKVTLFDEQLLAKNGLCKVRARVFGDLDESWSRFGDYEAYELVSISSKSSTDCGRIDLQNFVQLGTPISDQVLSAILDQSAVLRESVMRLPDFEQSQPCMRSIGISAASPMLYMHYVDFGRPPVRVFISFDDVPRLRVDMTTSGR